MVPLGDVVPPAPPFTLMRAPEALVSATKPPPPPPPGPCGLLSYAAQAVAFSPVPAPVLLPPVPPFALTARLPTLPLFPDAKTSTAPPPPPPPEASLQTIGFAEAPFALIVPDPVMVFARTMTTPPPGAPLVARP